MQRIKEKSEFKFQKLSQFLIFNSFPSYIKDFPFIFELTIASNRDLFITSFILQQSNPNKTPSSIQPLLKTSNPTTSKTLRNIHNQLLTSTIDHKASQQPFPHGAPIQQNTDNQNFLSPNGKMERHTFLRFCRF